VGLVNDNHHAEEFIGYLSEYLDIRGIRHSCVGVREQPAPDAQPHFDILVLVDGDRLHSPYHGLLEALDAVWSNLVGTDARGLLAVSIWKEAFEHRYVLNGGVMIPRDGEGSDAAYALLYRRASHMARSISKRWVPEGVESLLDVHARPRSPASQGPVAVVEAAAE
jgi:hypothetical protein